MYTIEELESWMNRLLDAYEEDPLDKKVKAELREVRYQVERMLESWPKLINSCKQTVSDYETKLNSDKLTKNKKYEAVEVITGNKKSIDKYENEIMILNNFKSTLDKYLSDDKCFDKYKCISNIKYFMNDKDIKIGLIENDANVRPGYMSRLNKPDNETMPSINFLISASKLLGVSIEELLFGNPGELSSNEKFINEFLNDLIIDTKKHEIHWNKEKSETFERRHCNRRVPTNHPLLEIVEDEEGNPGIKEYTIKYISKFFAEAEVYVKSCYSTMLPGSTNEVFIVGCFTNKADKIIPDNQFIEVYIVDKNDKSNPVCVSLKSAPTICSSLNSLFEIAANDSSNTYMDEDTRSIIMNYKIWRSGFEYNSERSKDEEQ